MFLSQRSVITQKIPLIDIAKTSTTFPTIQIERQTISEMPERDAMFN